MKTCHVMIAASLALLLAPTAALGQDNPVPVPPPVLAPSAGDVVRDDFICFIAMSAVGSQAPEDIQDSFKLVAMYFTGKLYGRDPELEMREVIASYSAEIERLDQQSELRRCLDEFQQVGTRLSAIGADRG